MLDITERRNALFRERDRAHRRWEIARAIGATRKTKDILSALADSRDEAFRRAHRAEKAALMALGLEKK